MDILQSNIDYVTNKIDIQNNDSVSNEQQFNYDPNIITTKGIEKCNVFNYWTPWIQYS